MSNSTLQKIARRLGRTLLREESLEGEFSRLKATAEVPVKPATPADTLQFFIHQCESNLFEITRCSHLEEMVKSLDSPLPLALSPQPRIRNLNWGSRSEDNSNDLTLPVLGVIEASWGIAETGTVTVASTDAPSSMLFLAEELLVILDTKNVVGFQEQVWQNIDPGQQRALHLISGPSRTADVEQTIQVGAHGPRKVYLWLVD